MPNNIPDIAALDAVNELELELNIYTNNITKFTEIF